MGASEQSSGRGWVRVSVKMRAEEALALAQRARSEGVSTHAKARMALQQAARPQPLRNLEVHPGQHRPR